jgi:uncharacterized membrane protein
MTKDTTTRSFAKSITWRVVSAVTTGLLVLLFTHQWTLAIAISALDTVVMILFYYVHERVWENISWGRIKSKKK